MADSNITKRALAAALKELMIDTPFTKITIEDICSQCGMSRKSFYYHFKDKFDLVNWIFESEFVAPMYSHISPDALLAEQRWDIAEALCKYFYDNKTFYSKVFKIKGQNCFTEYFKDLLTPLMYLRAKQISDDEQLVTFCVDFFIDAALCATERLIVEKNSIPPERFVELLRACIKPMIAFPEQQF